MPDVTYAGISLYAIALVFGYCLGSIPFGLLLTKAAGLGDVRAIGSGNIGATNVLRTGNKKLAAATLALDMLKGTAAVLIAGIFDPFLAMLAGFGAFIGHLYPLWLGFKGGKGVATYLGVLLGLTWKGGLIFATIWLVMAFVFGYSSLAALFAAALAPGALYLLGYGPMAILFSIMSIIVIIKHRANIARLIAGSESKIGKK
ncbi:MAG: glycerol-3-phosphate 1-O-acyltransferase PlsY [Rhizobiaceae bacterium]